MIVSHAVLLMAYGSPNSLDEVGEYYTHIRGGRTPPPDALAGLRARYQRVGGHTPLLRITRELQRLLPEALADRGGEGTTVYVGMKHWHPFIADTVRMMRDDGITHVTALPLAPHFSRISIGGYRSALQQGMVAADVRFETTFVASWHRNASYLALMEHHVRMALEDFPAAARTAVVTLFTAHSLPERIRTWDDPYESELAESAAAIAQRVSLDTWGIAWQSAGSTSERWIGPDILERLEDLASTGVRHVLVAPIGFTCEHLEILYDIDVEAQEYAERLGMTLRRIAMPNASPAFVETLAHVVADAPSLAAAAPG